MFIIVRRPGLYYLEKNHVPIFSIVQDCVLVDREDRSLFPVRPTDRPCVPNCARHRVRTLVFPFPFRFAPTVYSATTSINVTMGQKFGGDSFKERERERERERECVSLHQTVWRHSGTSRIDTAVLRLRKTEDRRGWDRFFADFRSRRSSSFFLFFFFLSFFFPPLLLFTVILNLPRHHYPLISPLPAPLPLSRGLVSESSCVHACTLARACVFNVHAFVLYTLHAYKYVYAYVLRTTNVGIVHLHTLPPAPSRPPFPRAPSPPLPRLPRITIDLHTNIPGISMGGMFISKSTWKFLPPYLWPLVFRKHASNTPLKRAGLPFRPPAREGGRETKRPFRLIGWKSTRRISLVRVSLLFVLPNT